MSYNGLSIYAIQIEGLGLETGDVYGTANSSAYTHKTLLMTEAQGELSGINSSIGDFTAVDCIEDAGADLAEEVDLIQLDSARSGKTFSLSPNAAVTRFFSLGDKETVGIVRQSSIGDNAYVHIDLHVKESILQDEIKIVYIQSSVMRITQITEVDGGIAQLYWEPIFGTDYPDLLSGYDDRVVYRRNQVVQGRMVRIYLAVPSEEEVYHRWTGYITSATTDEGTGLITLECAGASGCTNRASFGEGAPSGIVKLTRTKHDYGKINVSQTFNTEEFYPREYFPVLGDSFKGLFIPIVADKVVTYLHYGGSISNLGHNNILHGDATSVKPDITSSEADPILARPVVSTAQRVMELGGQVKDESGAASDHFIDIALNLLMSSGTYFTQWGGGSAAGRPVSDTLPGKNGRWDWLPAWAGMNVKEADIDIDSFLHFRATYPFSEVRLNNFLAGHKEEKFGDIMKGVLGSGGCFLTERGGKIAVASFAMSFFTLNPKEIGDDDVTIEDIKATNPDSLSGAVSTISLRCGDNFPSGSYRHTVSNTDLSLSTRRRYGAQERKVDVSLPYLGMPDTGRIPDSVLEAVRLIHGLMYSALAKESHTIELVAEPGFDIAIGDCVRTKLTTGLCGGIGDTLGFVYSFSESMDHRAIRLRVRLVDKASFGSLVSPSFAVTAASAGTVTISSAGYGADDRATFGQMFDLGMRKFEVGDASQGGNKGVVSVHSFTGYNQSTGVISGVSPTLTMASPNTFVIRLAPADQEVIEEFAYIGSPDDGLDGESYRRWAL